MSAYDLVQNTQSYTSGSHRFLNVGDGSNLPMDTLVALERRTVMTIQNCNVGIGTTLPAAPFDLVGDMQITGSILPSQCNVFNLGSSNFRFKDIFLSGNTIDLDGTLLTKDDLSGGLKITGRTGVPADTIIKSLTATSATFSGTVVASNLVVLGSNTTVDTYTIATSNVSISNVTGVGPALYVAQKGIGAGYPIADFYDVDVSTTVPTLRIADGGNVGIGTTIATEKLDVAGTVKATNMTTQNLNCYKITTTYLYNTIKNIRFFTQTGDGCSTITAGIIKNDYEIYIWGYNGYGQAGFGGSTNGQILDLVQSQLPINKYTGCVSPSDINIISAYISYFGTYILAKCGTSNRLFCVGYNGYGQLGIANTTNRYSFIETPLSFNPTYFYMSTQYNQGNHGQTGLLISDAGILYEVGIRADNAASSYYTSYTALNNSPSGGSWKFAKTDGNTIFAVTSDADGNKLYAMGYNGHGQLANGTTTNSTGTWVAVQKSGDYSQLSNVRSVNFGTNGSAQTSIIAITNDNVAYSWGFNTYGSLGLGNYTTPQNYATPINGVLFSSIKLCDNGPGAIGLTPTGDMYVWGYNQQGIGTGVVGGTNYNTPQLITTVQVYNGAGVANTISLATAFGGTNVWSKIYVGANSVRYNAIMKNGTAWGVGVNNYGAVVGVAGLTENTGYFTLTQMPEEVVDIFTADRYDGTSRFMCTYLLTATGRVFGMSGNWFQNVPRVNNGAVYTPIEIVIP